MTERDPLRIDNETSRQLEAWLSHVAFSNPYQADDYKGPWQEESRNVTINPSDASLPDLSLTQYRISNRRSSSINDASREDRISMGLIVLSSSETAKLRNTAWGASILANNAVFTTYGSFVSPLPESLSFEIAHKQQYVDITSVESNEVGATIVKQIQNIVAFYASISHEIRLPQVWTSKHGF